MNAKRQIRVKNSYESIIYQNKCWNISTKSPKVPLRPWAETWNTPLTQKDTWDRGAWIKIQKERHAGGLIWKGQKSKSTKVLKWHGNEEQMNISVFHMLRSCGVQAANYLKTSNNETHPSASTELSGLENLGFHSPKLDYHQWIKVPTFAIWEIQIAGRIQ